MRLWGWWRRAAGTVAAMAWPTRVVEIEANGCMAHYPGRIRYGRVVQRAMNSGKELRYFPKGTLCILIRWDDTGVESWQPLAPYGHWSAADVSSGFSHLMDRKNLTRFI